MKANYDFSKGKKNPYVALALVKENLGDCKRCGLCKTRKNIVFGAGSRQSDVMFIGEAPGEDEDLAGVPFVGKAGELLDKMITAMGYAREYVYIANVLKCRPPGNRVPEPKEIAKCLPFLKAQISALAPKVIITMGNVATRSLFDIEDGIMSIRGKWRDYGGIPTMPTFHPSFLLRQASAKKYVRDDLRAVLKRLAELGVTPPFEVKLKPTK